MVIGSWQLDASRVGVLLDEPGGLPQETLVHTYPWLVGGAHDLIDAGELLVVIEEGPQERVRREDLVQLLKLPEVLVEGLPPLLIPEVLKDRLRGLVVPETSGDREVALSTLLNEIPEPPLEDLDALYNSGDLIGVEGQCVLQPVEDTHEVQDQA